MKYIVALGLLLYTVPAAAQYGPYGPYPRGDYESGGRWPRTYTGPQFVPCMRYGNCRGPRYEEDPEQSWRRPRRPQYGPYYPPYPYD